MTLNTVQRLLWDRRRAAGRCCSRSAAANRSCSLSQLRHRASGKDAGRDPRCRGLFRAGELDW